MLYKNIDVDKIEKLYFTMIYNMPREQARKYVKELRKFYTAGWKSIMDFK